MASAQILTNGKALYAYNGTEWVPLNTNGNLVNSTRWQYTAVGSETSLSGNDDNGESLIYTPGFEQVYLNGVLLARDADYTATTGTTITGLTALTAGHIVEILAYNNINVGNTYTQGQIDNKIANTFTRWIDTLSASATVLSGLDDNSTTLSYTPGLEQVYVNGILLLPSEYTATSGSSVVLSEAAVSGDVIQIYTLKNFRVPNTYTIGQTDDQFLTKTSASSTYLTQSSASTTYAPVAAGGLVFLNTTSFTAQASVSINDVFSATYDNYKILINTTDSNANGSIAMRMRVSGADNSNNEYTRMRVYFDNSNSLAADNGSSGTSSFLVGNIQTTSGSQTCIELSQPFLTQRTKHVTTASQSLTGFVTAGSTTVTTSYTGFTLLLITAASMTGTVSVYGYKK
jgi:hypothetical protein